MFCWPCIIVTYLRSKHNQLDTHFTFTYTLIRFKVSTCFRHYLPIFRRHYMNAYLVTVVCGCSCGLVSECSRDQPTTTTVHNSHQICVRVVPPEDRRVTPETCRDWNLIKCKWKWSVYQVGCVYYVIPLNFYIRRSILLYLLPLCSVV
jgi:hypothetical protein